MNSFAIEKFLGLTDISGVVADTGSAETAIDIDFRSNKGRLQGKRGSMVVAANGSITGLYIWGAEIINSKSDTLYSTASSIKSSWGGSFTATPMYGKLVMVNGTQPIKYNGTNVYNLGITPPVITSMTATGTGAGALTVVTAWKYKITYVNGDGFESNTDTTHEISSGAFAAKASCDLAVIPTGAAADNVTARKIYRTTDGGSVYFYLATISNNTTTTYVDTTLDGNLGSTTYPTNHDVPLATLTIIASACNRLFGVSSANTRRLYASLPDSNFEGWPGTYYWDLQDDIRAVEPLVDRLIIYTDVGVVSFVIPDSTNVDSFYFSEPLSLQTTQSAHAVCRFWNGLVFRGPRGIYFSDGVSAKLITEHQESLFGALSTTQKLSATETSLFYIVEPFGMTTEFGTIVGIDSVSDTCVFSAELGVVIDVADSDTYTFSTELGVEIDWGSTDTANQILQVDTDYNNVCHMLSDAAVCMASDDLNNALYIGTTAVVKKMFSGARTSWKWKSKPSYLNLPRNEKSMDHIHLWLNGTATVNLYADGSLVWSKAFTTSKMELVEEYTRDAVGGPVRGTRFAVEFVADTEAVVEPPFIYWFFVEGLDEPGRISSVAQTA